MRFLRTNTAVMVTVGPFYDKTDGVTIKTALTITNEKITLTADTDAGSAPTNILDNVTGATSGTANDLNYITGNDAGMMQLELAAADVNRLGRMFLSITDAANHVPVFHEFMVLPAMIYDSLVLGTDDLDTNTKKWNDLTTVALPLVPATAGRTLVVDAAGLADANAVKLGPSGSGTAQTARDIGTSVLLSNGTGTGQLKLASGYVAVTWADIAAPTTVVALSGTTVKTATDVATQATDIQARLPAALTSDGLIKADPLRVAGTVQTAGDIVALINTMTTYVDTEVAAIKAITDVFVNADRLDRAAKGVVTGTVGSASTTTNVVTSACSPAGVAADQFKGRIMIFDRLTTTTSLRGQATDITASSAAATPDFTVTALTTAPVSGDTFTIQ